MLRIEENNDLMDAINWGVEREDLTSHYIS
jgi:hypothetical protein